MDIRPLGKDIMKLRVYTGRVFLPWKRAYLDNREVVECFWDLKVGLNRDPEVNVCVCNVICDVAYED